MAPTLSLIPSPPDTLTPPPPTQRAGGLSSGEKSAVARGYMPKTAEVRAGWLRRRGEYVSACLGVGVPRQSGGRPPAAYPLPLLRPPALTAYHAEAIRPKQEAAQECNANPSC